VLSEVIKLAKKNHFDNLITNSKNQTKTTCSIVKTVTRSKVNVNNISLLNVNDNLTNDSQIILNAFNKYFLTVAENINVENLYYKNSLLTFWHQSFTFKFYYTLYVQCE
jgi:hypothetical protein